VKTVTQVCRACADDGVGAEGTVLKKKNVESKTKSSCVCASLYVITCIYIMGK